MKLSLLLVEDEPDLLDLLASEIALLGLNAFCAENVCQAKAILEKESVHGVLSDLSMPDGTGFDLLEYERRNGRSTPFLFLTAHDIADFCSSSSASRHILYLEKPFQRIDFKSQIEKILRLSSTKQGEVLSVSEMTDEISVADIMREIYLKKNRG